MLKYDFHVKSLLLFLNYQISGKSTLKIFRYFHFFRGYISPVCEKYIDLQALQILIIVIHKLFELQDFYRLSIRFPQCTKLDRYPNPG